MGVYQSTEIDKKTQHSSYCRGGYKRHWYVEYGVATKTTTDVSWDPEAAGWKGTKSVYPYPMNWFSYPISQDPVQFCSIESQLADVNRLDSMLEVLRAAPKWQHNEAAEACEDWCQRHSDQLNKARLSEIKKVVGIDNYNKLCAKMFEIIV